MNDVTTEMAALDGMTTGELATQYEELHGWQCRTRHRAYLILVSSPIAGPTWVRKSDSILT